MVDNVTKLITIAIASLLLNSAATAESLELIANGEMADFAKQVSDKIPNHTTYEWVADEAGRQVLEANAVQAAAGMALEQEIPIPAHATIEVELQVLEARNSADEQTKPGDDFPLRIYVTGKSFLVYKTLVAVVSRQYPQGTAWESPYSAALVQFNMYAFAGTETEMGSWHTFTIPIGKLWQATYGDDITTLEALSFMVDSDNAGGVMRTRIAKLIYTY